MPAWEVKLYIKLFFSKGDLDERSDDYGFYKTCISNFSTLGLGRYCIKGYSVSHALDTILGM